MAAIDRPLRPDPSPAFKLRWPSMQAIPRYPRNRTCEWLRRTTPFLFCGAAVFVFIGNKTGCDRTTPPKPPNDAAIPSAEPEWQPRRPEFQEIADRLRRSENEYSGYGLVQKWRQALERDGLSAIQRIEGITTLAWLHLRAGEIDEAVARIDAASDAVGKSTAPTKTHAYVLRMRGLIYLRKAEVQNCILRHNRDCCIFPLSGGGVHTAPAPAAEARASFAAYLKLHPDDGSVGWLLNIIAMALGDYPDAVPEPYRIPPEALKPDLQLGRFVDVAPRLGLDTFNQCGGVIAEDFDGDDQIDIVTSTFDPGGPLTYYRNRGDGRFDDLSAASRLDDQLGGLNCVGADYDNDGDTDILVLRGAWLKEDGQIRNSLLRNNGDGTFDDVTHRAGLADPARPTQAAAWGDFDNDGDLDVYIVNESRVEYGGASYPAQMFQNNGDGTFTDIAPQAGVTNDGWTKGVTAGDYDNDGDLDLYVSNFIEPNRL